MHVVRKVVSLLLTGVTSAMLLAACHGSSSTTTSTTPPTATFTYAQAAPSTPFSLNFNATGSKAADGSTPTYTWSFGDQIPSTSTQVLTGVTVNHIYAQPGTYVVSLTVTDDHATSAVQIQKITVTGTPSILMGVENWTWVTGSQYANSVGGYVSQFSPNVNNQPSARQNGATWVHGMNGVADVGGKMWLFGGGGNDSTGSSGLLNDLWYFTPATSASSCGAVTNSSGALTSGVTSGCWTWVAGSNRGNAEGIYPPTSTNYPDSSTPFIVTNFPGARTAPAAWTDAGGNFWMFGGNGYDSAAALGNLNDMWKFNGATGQANWVAGSKLINDQGATNLPRARSFATTWTTYDSTHTVATFWLFGGQSLDSANTTSVQLNDLWSFNPSTNVWTFVAGSTSAATIAGNYGTKGTAALTNLPGSRINAQAWVDGAGKLWMFGGSGSDSGTSNGSLSDVWSFDPATKMWTWVAGSNVVGAAEVSATQGVASTSNTPSARLGTVGWTDKSGTLLWLFGGSGTDSTGTTTTSDGAGALNELWVFNTQTLAWAYMGGYNVTGTAGVYANGTGVASNQNSPGSRIWSSGWLDSNNNFWMFGGAGDDMSGNSGYLNDLWMVNTNVLPH